MVMEGEASGRNLVSRADESAVNGELDADVTKWDIMHLLTEEEAIERAKQAYIGRICPGCQTVRHLLL